MSLLHFLFAPTTVYALENRFVVLTTGIRIPYIQVFSNVINFLAISAVGICTVLFLVGAAQLTMSRGDQTKVDNGKKLMISSLVGLGIILSAYAVTSTVLYFLFEWAA